tara:strand:+ start:79 stop:285 length:207 start_codon:yes stop_codon:yes gene_type:complete
MLLVVLLLIIRTTLEHSPLQPLLLRFLGGGGGGDFLGGYARDTKKVKKWIQQGYCQGYAHRYLVVIHL